MRFSGVFQSASFTVRKRSVNAFLPPPYTVSKPSKNAPKTAKKIRNACGKNPHPLPPSCGFQSPKNRFVRPFFGILQVLAPKTPARWPFSHSLCVFTGLGNGLMACPFHATDLPGRESLKNMKPESPFLNLGQSAHCKKLLQGFPGILAVLYVNNSFFPFFIQSASGTMLRFLQTVDRNILAGLGALCPILLIVLFSRKKIGKRMQVW